MNKFLLHLLHIEERRYQCFPHRDISCGGLIHLFEQFLHQFPHVFQHCFGFSIILHDFWLLLSEQSSVRPLKRDFYLTGLYPVIWFNHCGKGDANKLLPNWALRIRSSSKEVKAQRAGSWGKMEGRLAAVRNAPSMLMSSGISGRTSNGPDCSLCVYSEAWSLHRICLMKSSRSCW